MHTCVYRYKSNWKNIIAICLVFFLSYLPFFLFSLKNKKKDRKKYVANTNANSPSQGTKLLIEFESLIEGKFFSVRINFLFSFFF